MAQGRKRIYTLGTSNRSLEEFLEILHLWGINQVVDVRRFPTSSRYPWFHRAPLSSSLAEKGVSYHSMSKELGGYRKEGYQAFLRTEDFRVALSRMEALAVRASTAIICAERLPWRCHRLLISKALEERGWRVIHILDKERTWNPSPQRPLFTPEEGV